MKRKQIIVIMLTLLFVGQMKAQQIDGVKIGDMMPDFTIDKLLNYSKKSAKLSDFNDRLVIMDIWSTGCSGCVAALPKREALQKQFGDKIQVLAVTKQGEAQVKAFWKTNNYTKNLKNLSIVVEDKIICKYFFNQLFYPQIWIYKGKLIGVTESEYVDPYNVQQVLEGKTPTWPVWSHEITFDPAKDYILLPKENLNVFNSTSFRNAVIGNYKEGFTVAGEGGENIIRNPINKTIRAYYINDQIWAIYTLCWYKLINYNSAKELVTPSIINPNSICWEVTDKSKYIYDSSKGYRGDWLQKNGICFEAIYPDKGQSDIEVSRSIVNDLDSLLGLHVRWEKRKEKVHVLVRTTRVDKIKTKNANVDPEKTLTIKGTTYLFRNTSLSNICYQLNQQATNPYVFDETDYKGNVDMDLVIPSWTNIQAVRKALQPYGLDLKEEERLVDKFVFTEVNGGKITNIKMQIDAKAKRIQQKNMKNATEEENKTFLENNKNKPGVNTLSSGLQYKVIKEGKGEKPTANSQVVVNYTGTLVNGKIFDSSFERGMSLTFGVTEVIKGWTEVLQLMPVGSKWIVYIPAELAYAEHTLQGKIPPNSVMIFELELLRIEKK